MNTRARGRCAALVASVAVSALATPAYAQTPIQLPPVDAAPPEDTPDREAAPSTREVKGEVLVRRRLGTGDAVSLIAQEPGMAYANGGISSLPVMRGLADDRVLLTIDGAESTGFCPNRMNPPGSYVSPTRIEGVVILPTLSPVSAGGDNTAGVIAVTTRGPAFAGESQGSRLAGEVGAAYRSVADGVALNLRLEAAGERLAGSYEAAWNRAENYRSGGGRRVRSTLYDASDHVIAIAYRTDQGVISLRAGRQFQPYQGFPTQRMDLTENETRFADLSYEASYGWGELSAQTSWRAVDHEMNFLQDKGGSANGGMPMNSQGRDLSGKLALTLPLNDGQAVRLGVETHQARLEDWWPPVAGSAAMGPQTYVSIRDGRRERLGFWGEWEARPLDRWTALLGARLERVRTDAGSVQPYAWTGMMNAADAAAARVFNATSRKRADDNLDLTAKAIWRASDAATLEFGYARKTRTPNLYERYAWGRGAMSSSMTAFAGDANGYVGDPNLHPEVAHHLAASLRYVSRDGKRRLVLGAYRSQIDDYIDARKLGELRNGFVKLQFANVDARLYGFDGSLRTQLWDTPALGRTDLTGTAAFAAGQNRDTHDDLYHMTPLTVRLGVEQAKGRWANAAEVELVGRKHAVNRLRNEPRTGGYALMHLRSSWQGENLRLDLAIENLFDTAYDLPLGGVAFGDFKAGGSVPPIRPLPGPGRSFNMALAWTF